MVKVCVDVIGGDLGHEPVLQGVALALEADPELSILLAGPHALVTPFADAHERCEALVAEQSIGMDESPVDAVRKKRDSSIVIGCNAVKKRKADAFFSAGSTGAILAAATLIVGRIKGIQRPALMTVFPSVAHNDTVMLDLGANADVRPDALVQFAEMGALYAKTMLNREKPQVCLLSNGSEDKKGSALNQQYFEALTDAAQVSNVYDFKGNCEGNDILSGYSDVIVTDGFTGNVALKSIEGAGMFMLASIKESVDTSLAAKAGAFMLKNTLRSLKDEFSAAKHGGAQLIGLKAPVLIGHGKTSPRVVKQAIIAASEVFKSDICGKIALQVKPATS